MINSKPLAVKIPVVETALRGLSAGCLGIGIGWLVVCRHSSATPFGTLSVSTSQVVLVASVALLCVGGALWAGRDSGRVVGGGWAALASVGLMVLAGWIGLALALGALHKIPGSLAQIAHGLIVAGGLASALAVILPLQGVSGRRAIKGSAFIVGVLLMVLGPVILEQP